MSAFNSSILSQVHALVTQIKSALPEATAHHPFSSPFVQPDILRLESPRSELLRKDLISYKISEGCQEALISLYEGKHEALSFAYLDAYKKAATSLHYQGQLDNNFCNSFRSSLEHDFSMQAERLWTGLLAEVCRFTGASQNVSVGSPGFGPGSLAPCSDTTSKAARGHDSDAIRILEQAFEHTPNITQAEKFRLAEVTGLQPKQVTIWFQNRRNRKVRKALAHQHVAQSPTNPSLSKQVSAPPSSPARDFTLSEKKRKSYGALGRFSSDDSDSDSDSPTSQLKKPRLPSACSDISDGSASSVDQIMAFTPWSTPSSRSTSSSSASSSQSDLFDSPRKAHNVFEYMKPKHEGRANASMPNLTIGTPQKVVHQGLQPAQRSPFTSDAQGGGLFKAGGFNLSGLQLNAADLRESVQRVLFEPGSCRSASSSSWGSEQVTTDDDGWVDEDDFDVFVGGRHIVDAEAHGQPALVPPVFQSVNAAVDGQAPSQIASSQSVPPTVPNAGSETTADSTLSNTASFDNDTLDLARFLELAAAPTLIPTSSPFGSQPQQPLITADTNTNLPCSDLDLEMIDIQSILDSDVFASSLPSSQQSNGESGAGDGPQQGTVSGAQFFMNFDLSSNPFYLA